MRTRCSVGLVGAADDVVVLLVFGALSSSFLDFLVGSCRRQALISCAVAATKSDTSDAVDQGVCRLSLLSWVFKSLKTGGRSWIQYALRVAGDGGWVLVFRVRTLLEKS